MKKLFFIISFVFISLLCVAQKTYPSVKTSTDVGRWEIIQSPFIRRVTIKLDKFTGKTYQILETSLAIYEWKIIIWQDEDWGEKQTGKINYQIFMGGLTGSDVYLINIHTGKTWLLCEDSSKGLLFWSKIDGV